MRAFLNLLTNTIFTICLCLILTVLTAQAATLTVTKTADSNDNVCNADCSLREAVIAAVSGDEIVFASPLFDSPQTITLLDGGGFRDLVINKNLTITGKGANLLTIQRASGNFRIFNVNGSGVQVRLNKITVSGGDASNFNGGGINANGGVTLTISDCAIRGNVAASGGGIFVTNDSSLTLNRSTVSGNTADGASSSGGGIHNEGTLIVNNSTISGNVKNNAANNGGGIWTNKATTITGSTITDNGTSGSNSAGGVYRAGGTVTVRNTIIAANRNNTSINDVFSDSGAFTSGGYNLIGSTLAGRGFTNGVNNDQAGSASSPINPMLDALGDYGGATQTHRLQTGSPAIDKGSSFGLNSDQRGNMRPVDNINITNAAGGDGADIGAYEVSASITVTNPADTTVGACDSDCTLREAIAAAGEGYTIEFSSLFDSPQVITLSDAAGFRELIINKNLTINGKGAHLLTVRRDPATTGFFRIFLVSEANVVLTGMTISGGKTGASTAYGAGIYNSPNSTLTINACHITGNTVISDSSSLGGGISNSGGRLYINDSTISNNTVMTDTSNAGGGIYTIGPETIITNSTISGNTVVNRGNNSTHDNSGGIFNYGVTTLRNSTVTDNGVDGANSASGVYNALSLTIGSTIVAGNRNNSTVPDVKGVFSSQGFNLIGNVGAASGFDQPSDQIGSSASPINPLLQTLAANGGTTPTHALLAASPAIDKGSSFDKNRDQRGQPRPFDNPSVLSAPGGDGSDIGAYEEQSLSPNQPPVAVADSYTTDEDVRLIVGAPGVLTNDSDPEGSPLTAILVQHPSRGGLTLNSNGSFTYTQIANTNGTDSFTYKVNDGTSDSNVATVTINVNSVNDIPVAVNDTYNVRPNNTLTIPSLGVLQNDRDVESPLSAILVSSPTHGALNFNSNGGFTYTPDMDFLGTDSFTYRANDGEANSNVATVNILVRVPVQWTVTSIADTTVGACDSNCTLREAIAAASNGDEIIFASPLFDTPQTITLTNGAGFNDLVINKSLTIFGRGANLLTIRRNIPGSNPPPEQKFRIFNVNGSGVRTTLIGMTITGGFANPIAAGGGINNNSGSTLTVKSCHITDNKAGTTGGGIYNAADSTLNVIDSTVSNNFGYGPKGGAGIDNRGVLLVINSTVSGNNKWNSNVESNNNGGGIYTSGTAIITNSTIADNMAVGTDSGAGVFNDGASLTIRNTIIAANRFNFVYQNTLTPDVGGTQPFTSQGYNLIGKIGTATGFNQTGDQTGTVNEPLDPQLHALANNGGSVPTHQLSPTSPAVDKGMSFGSTTDQRGSLRPADSATVVNLADGADIGAFELQFAPTAATVSIGGRVLAADGIGLRNARVTLTDQMGNARTILTGKLGYFRFNDVAAGETYVISIASKRYLFQPQVINATEDITDLYFIGSQRPEQTEIPNAMN